MTCDAHFRTQTCYSSQKSCVKIWFGLSEIGDVHFQGGQKPPIRGVTCDLWSPSSNLAELFQSKVMCENLVRIAKTFQELSCPQTLFPGGGRPPIWGVYMWPVMPIFELGRAIPVKSHVWKFGLDWLKSEVCIFKGGGRNPVLGALHVTCDPHLRTWPSYSSQKSCVKIWFGLVKPFRSYRVHKHFSGGRNPH